MKYTLVKQVRDKPALRKDFFSLAQETFGLSFEDWFQNGFWTDRYIPYALTEENRVLSNASVNIIDTVWRGREMRLIQIGTVMTRPEYRNRGLARRIIAEILADWREKSEAVYLYANDAALHFYPKCGFQPAAEYQYSRPVCPTPGDFAKLDMGQLSSRALLARCYRASNPFSELPVRDQYGLVMFYCTGGLKDCVYYSKEYDTVCVAQAQGNILLCYDLFGEPSARLETVLEKLAEPQIQRVELGFTPTEKTGYHSRKIQEEDTTLFVYAGIQKQFQQERVMMPLLFRA